MWPCAPPQRRESKRRGDREGDGDGRRIRVECMRVMGPGREAENIISRRILALDSDKAHRSHGCLNTADSDMLQLELVLCMTPPSRPYVKFDRMQPRPR